MPRKMLGPILYIGHCEPTIWRFYVNLLIEGGDTAAPPVDVVSGDSTVMKPVIAADFSSSGLDGYILWRWPVEVQRTDGEQWISYTVQAKPGVNVEGLRAPLTVDDVAVPAKDVVPHLAFFSCNGFDDPKLSGRVQKQDELWEEMLEIHQKARRERTADHPGGYHLLLGGGDQIYADCIWMRQGSPLKRFETPLAVRKNDRLTERQAQRVLGDYVKLYVERWGRVDPAAVFARIPGLFTWDDHDIFDGWGSYKEEQQASRLFQQVYQQASRAFEAFQIGTSAKLGGSVSEHLVGNGNHYLQKLEFRTNKRRLLVVSLDLRSERRIDRVLSDEQWTDLQALSFEEPDPDGTERHLLVISSIPVVYMKFDLALRALEIIPGYQDLEDDIRDHWSSWRHRGERSRLIMKLLEFGKVTKSRVTILSGDVHIGARGRIVSRHPDHLYGGTDEIEIEQITSSGIVYPPPSRGEFLGVLATGTEGVDKISSKVSAESKSRRVQEPGESSQDPNDGQKRFFRASSDSWTLGHFDS